MSGLDPETLRLHLMLLNDTHSRKSSNAMPSDERPHYASPGSLPLILVRSSGAARYSPQIWTLRVAGKAQ
jgi:hypothetical protein